MAEKSNEWRDNDQSSEDTESENITLSQEEAMLSDMENIGKVDKYWSQDQLKGMQDHINYYANMIRYISEKNQ